MLSLRWHLHLEPGIRVRLRVLHRTSRPRHNPPLRRSAAYFGLALACQSAFLRVVSHQTSMITWMFGVHPPSSSVPLSCLRIPPIATYGEALRGCGHTLPVHSSSWCRRTTLSSLLCILRLPERQGTDYGGGLELYLPPRNQVSPLAA